MNKFGLEGSGFIIAISVCLLLVGAVVYYFNTRVANLEKALVKQNQVLADFIQNVKTSHIQERNMQMQVVEHSPPNGATQEAVIAARDYFSTEVPQEKVDVSDNEEEDSGSEEDESELESEIDDSSEDESKKINSGSGSIENTDVNVDSLIMSNNSAIIGAILVDMTGIDGVESLSVTEGPTVVELLDQEDNDNIEPDNLKPAKVKQEEAKAEDKKIIKLGDVDNLDEVSSSLGSSIGDEEEEDDGVTIDSKQENVITDFSKLKVAKLKELASKSGIKNATKLKKTELVAALEANK